MALPVTITGLQAAKRIVGAFKSSTNNYYLFGVDGTTATTLRAYKSTAPDTSWASIASQTGYATAILGLAGYQNADVIHLVVNDGTGTSWNYKYPTFNMATDAFVAAETIASAINPQDSAAGVYGLCEIVFRPSDSQPITELPIARVSTHAKVGVRRRTGVATWAAAVVLDPVNIANDYYPVGMCLGASNICHFAMLGIAGGFSQRAFTSANAAQTAVAMTAFSPNDGTCKGASLVSGGSTKVCFVGRNSGNNAVAAYFDSANVPTINTSAAIGSSGAVNPGVKIFANGTDFWALYTRSDTGDVYAAQSTTFGATWGAETLVMSSVTATTSGPNGDEFLSFNGTVYTRGANTVFGFVVNDAGTLKYNELVVSAPATNFFNNPILP